MPLPLPAAGEVRIKLACSGVNPSDVKTRNGLRVKLMPFPLVVPHHDGAGVIDAVGAGVAASRIGERVWTWNAAWGRAFGTAAEYVALPSQQAVHLPDCVSLAEGACLGIPALTACHALNVDGGVAGKSVLIAGGAGAVGHYAIQLARLKGARQIISTVSTPDKAALATAAGADAVINYKSEDAATRVLELTGGAGVDHIVEVDFAGNVQLDFACARSDGQIVIYGSNQPEISVPFVPAIFKNLRLDFFILYNLPAADRDRAIAEVSAALAEGCVQHNVALRLPLERIVEAHETVESGRATGNVVIDV